MPPRSPTTVGMAVETTVISIAAIERLKRSETTVSGRLVFIVANRCVCAREGARSSARPRSARLLQRRRVDAVALAGRCGPVLEHVAEMSAAPAAVHLHALHAVARIALRGDRAGVGGAREARPPGAALELVVGAEQLGAAARAHEAPGLVIVPQRSAEGALGPLLAEHAVLLQRQLAAPLLLALLDLLVHGAADSSPSAAGRRPLPARDALFEQVGEVRLVRRTGRQLGHARLGKRALDERRDVRLAVPDGAQPVRHLQP